MQYQRAFGRLAQGESRHPRKRAALVGSARSRRREKQQRRGAVVHGHWLSCKYIQKRRSELCSERDRDWDVGSRPNLNRAWQLAQLFFLSVDFHTILSDPRLHPPSFYNLVFFITFQDKERADIG